MASKNKKKKQPITKTQKKERYRKIGGIVVLFFTAYLALALISYVFNWRADQDQVFHFSWQTLWDNNLVMQNWCGRMGAVLSNFFIYWGFGMSSFLLLPFLYKLGWFLLRGKKEHSLTYHFAYLMGLMIYLSVFFEAFFLKTAFPWGGTIGEGLTYWVSNFIGEVGLYALLLLTVIIIIIWSINPNFSDAQIPWQKLWPFTRSPIAVGVGAVTENVPLKPSYYTKPGSNQIEPEEDEQSLARFNKFGQMEFVVPDAAQLDNGEESLDDDVDFEMIEPQGTTPAPEDLTSDTELEIQESAEHQPLPVEMGSHQHGEHIGLNVPVDPQDELRSFKFPTLELLDDYSEEKVEIDRAELEANKDQIISTLLNYKIEITKIRATIGPTVTLYEIVPAPGVRISRIKNLEDDIALSLSALGIRIIAPIPGKGTIGIEVPNKKKQVVSLREVLASDKYHDSKMELPVALGKTIANEVFVADLAKMPHLLIAGATGQGKSVGINTVLMSLLYKKHPSEVKLVLIDPKKVELFPYSKLKEHYLAFLPDAKEAITTETSKVINILNSLCIEMDTRYDLLKKGRARNIKEYNAKYRRRELNPENGHKFLPFIILVIDEFADLIMTAGKEIELPIGRLAQLARAVGIHLIIATQRPSVNIITGIIKANFPARIGFKVTSKIDSRTILDRGGAEQLIGRGDMLLNVGGDMIRLQCAFVDTPEVERVLDHIHDQPGFSEPFYLPEYQPEGEAMIGESGLAWDELDDQFEDAARLVVQNQLGSTSMIQRRMKLGYNRAGRIMDQLEQLNIVGAADGSKPREVLVFSEMELEHLLEELKKK